MMHKKPSVLMIGWELPPQNSGGLGVACAGLTQALHEDGIHVDFTLPYEYQGEADYLNVIDCFNSEDASPTAQKLAARLIKLREQLGISNNQPPFEAYVSSNTLDDRHLSLHDWHQLKKLYYQKYHHLPGQPESPSTSNKAEFLPPFSEMEKQVDLYSELVFEAALKSADNIDVVHAHDWMALPAAIKIKEELGKPVIAHIHSTEFDRTLNPDFNSYITRAEYEGMRLADRVIAVSYYTKRLLVEKYLIDPYKIEVVHNGVNPHGFHRHLAKSEQFAPEQPVVVFMGRLTMQKGADYFLALAEKILSKRPDALFVMAGNGDMYHDLLLRNAHYGLSASVLFTDFLRGSQRDELLRRADVFVMPSVSEPFGLVALEAVQSGTPVVISKNSGVAEVLYDTPAVDFWDIDQLAQETLTLISDDNYHQDLLKRQFDKLKDVTWKKSAQKVETIYQALAKA